MISSTFGPLQILESFIRKANDFVIGFVAMTDYYVNKQYQGAKLEMGYSQVQAKNALIARLISRFPLKRLKFLHR